MNFKAKNVLPVILVLCLISFVGHKAWSTEEGEAQAFLMSKAEFIQFFQEDTPVETMLEAVVLFKRQSSRASGIILGMTPDRRVLMLTANHNLSYRPSLDRLGAELDGLKNSEQVSYPVDRLLVEVSFNKSVPKEYMAFPFYAPSPLASGVENVKSSQDFAFSVISNADPKKYDGTDEFVRKNFSQRQKVRSLQFGRGLEGDLVFAVGFPSAANQQQMVSMGQILSNVDAKTVLRGSISPYDERVEFLAHGVAHVGMSGGGVFNEKGELLGVISRKVAGDYIRVIRIEHILRSSIERARRPFFDESAREILMDLEKKVGNLSCERVLAGPFRAK